MDLTQVEARIRESVERVRREGVKIVCNRYGVRWSGTWTTFDIGDGACCCPLGAVLLTAPPDFYKPTPWLAVKDLLGVGDNWVGGFVGGFDGAVLSSEADLGDDARAGRALGLALRREYITQGADGGHV